MIIDFGLSESDRNSKKGKIKGGTLGFVDCSLVRFAESGSYRAPECWTEDKLDTPVDIWAAGVIAYIL